jgi:respiratory nitrate reductase gamma subunit
VSPLDVVLWIIIPYLATATFVLGHIWRYRYDKFGWTTRSSQLYESRLLRLGSPLFHFGILLVAAATSSGSWCRRRPPGLPGSAKPPTTHLPSRSGRFPG